MNSPEGKSRATLHYVFDPLCGWCYAAAPLVKASTEIERMHVVLHGGGMMDGQRITPQMRDYIVAHDQRIAELSGQSFGADYTDGLLRDNSVVKDSTPPIAAILAAMDCGTSGLEMLGAIQHAHYVEGRKVADEVELNRLAHNIGIPDSRFGQALAKQMHELVFDHINATRSLMANRGIGGFPSLWLEWQNQAAELQASRYYGQPREWTRHLVQLIDG